MFFACYICSADIPIDFKNRHHKVPASLGGSDDDENSIYLCAGCHQDMHTIARMMRNPKKAGEVRSALQAIYTDDSGAQKRCLELAQLECRSRVLNREKVAADTEREIGIRFKLKRPYRDALQLIARDRGFSMANYVKKLVETHVLEMYPGLPVVEKN